MANKFNKTGYNIKCANDACNTIFYIKKSVYENGLISNRVFCCSRQCCMSPSALAKKKEFFIKKYGVENVYQMESVKQTIANTNIKKYGVKNPFQSKKIKTKIKKTLLKKYGVDHPQRSIEIRLKTMKTLQNRYQLIGYCNKPATERTMLERYGATHFFASELGKMTEENFIKRYGRNEGLKKFNGWKRNHGITIERMMSKWGTELGKTKYDKWKREVASTLTNFIHRHGEQDGLDRWKNYVMKIHGNTSKCSKISLKLFDAISEKLVNKDLCMFDEKNEWKIFLTGAERRLDPLNRTCLYSDFKYGNKIIEFYGNYWHKDSLYADTFKESILKTRGFDVMIVWENDYRKNENGILTECLSFLEK